MANVLTHVGKAIVTGRLLSTPPGAGTPGSAPPRYIGWGTGVTANNGAGNNGIPANVVDTALAGEETAEARAAGTESRVTTGAGATNDTYQVQGTMTALGSKTITNAGLFDTAKAAGAAPTGNLFAKGDFTGVALNADDSIAFTFKWQLQ